MSVDLTSQRLGELIFASLTKKDKDMQPQPDLAKSWAISKDGKTWTFEIRKDARDQSGAPITAQSMAACLEEYRDGKPHSPLMSAFSSVKDIEADGSRVIFRLNRPDPYLATNLSLLRYFTAGDPSKPCREPHPGQVITASGEYRPSRFGFEDLTPEQGIELIPQDSKRSRLSFSWTIDDNTKALKLIRGEVDALPTSLSLSKTRWIETHFPDRFHSVERDEGVPVSYLAFNLRNPVLKNLMVRRAIALAIDRESFVRYRLYGFGSLAGSLLSPVLPESAPQAIPFDPAEAERLLDRAGYPRGSDGTRLSFRYKTTPIRDGYETAEILQGMLQKIGVELVIEVVEPAVFLASIKKGAFDIYSSRWIGISDASILPRTLRTGSPDNRVGYSDPQMDRWLDEGVAEVDLAKRKQIFAKVQEKMVQDLPYMPLWFWNPDILMRNDLTGVEASDISLSGSLEPLTHLRYR